MKNEKPKIKLADVECIDNRKMTGIEELAANIASVGLLVPLLIMPYDGKYRVVDGRRRFRALQHLKREFLEPEQYVIWRGSDEQEKEAAFSANFARQNLTLSEEVAQLRQLTGTFTQIAQLLGKTSSWVALRRNLANLSGKWVEVLNNPTEYPQWTAAKLEIIAREPAEVQKRIEYMRDDVCTMDEIQTELDDEHRRIADACFDTAACMECPKRSGAQGMLFSELDEKNDSCLDAKCFMHKGVEFVKGVLKNRSLIPLRGERAGYADEDYQFADKLRAKSSYDFAKVREPKAGEEPNAIVVCGAGIGQLRVAVPRKDAPVGAAAPKSISEDGEKVVRAEKSVKEREAELAAKRNKCALQKLLERLKKKDTVERWMKRGNYDEKKAHISCLKLAMWYGVRGDEEGTYSYSWSKPKWRKEAEFETQVLDHAIKRMQGILNTEIARTLADTRTKVGPGICGLLFLDWQEFMKAAEAEIPEPKSLQVARIKEKQAKNRGGEKR